MGLEFAPKQFSDFSTKEGIKFEPSAEHYPEQNGKAEKVNHIVQSHVRATIPVDGTPTRLNDMKSPDEVSFAKLGIEQRESPSSARHQGHQPQAGSASGQALAGVSTASSKALRAVQFIAQLKENESLDIEKWTLEKRPSTVPLISPKTQCSAVSITSSQSSTTNLPGAAPTAMANLTLDDSCRTGYNGPQEVSNDQSHEADGDDQVLVSPITSITPSATTSPSKNHSGGAGNKDDSTWSSQDQDIRDWLTLRLPRDRTAPTAMADSTMDGGCRAGADSNRTHEVGSNDQSREAEHNNQFQDAGGNEQPGAKSGDEAHAADINNHSEGLDSMTGSETATTVTNTPTSPVHAEANSGHTGEHGFQTVSGVTYHRLPRIATVPGVRLVSQGPVIHPGWQTPKRMVREGYWSLECPLPGGYWRIVRRYRWVDAAAIPEYHDVESPTIPAEPMVPQDEPVQGADQTETQQNDGVEHATHTLLLQSPTHFIIGTMSKSKAPEVPVPNAYIQNGALTDEAILVPATLKKVFSHFGKMGVYFSVPQDFVKKVNAVVSGLGIKCRWEDTGVLSTDKYWWNKIGKDPAQADHKCPSSSSLLYQISDF
ncbi:hypothetical protein BKA80DRAFT_253980 [Phyllosticta citrichinensis]